MLTTWENFRCQLPTYRSPFNTIFYYWLRFVCLCMGHLLNNQLKWKLLFPLQYINRCQTDQENIKVSIEKCWWRSFRWIKLKAHLTNLFSFQKKRGKLFYVPIEHVIQQAFIGIFRINSWGRSKHFFTLFEHGLEENDSKILFIETLLKHLLLWSC